METVLFDLDCTLVDSLYVWHDGLRDMMEELGIECDYDKEFSNFLRMTGSEIYVYIHEKWQTDKDEAWMSAYMDRFLLHAYEYDIQEIPGATAFLAQCKEEGKKTAVVTNSPLKLVMPVLTRLGMIAYLDEIISCEETGMSKRDPDFYRIVMAGLEATPETTHLFEDNQMSIDNAKACGISCTGIESNHTKLEGVPVIRDFTSL